MGELATFLALGWLDLAGPGPALVGPWPDLVVADGALALAGPGCLAGPG